MNEQSNKMAVPVKDASIGSAQSGTAVPSVKAQDGQAKEQEVVQTRVAK